LGRRVSSMEATVSLGPSWMARLVGTVDLYMNTPGHGP
jgi:hypothetical protein